jgi:hypothetical protein
LFGAYPVRAQCVKYLNGAAAENDFLLSKKAPEFLDQEAVLFIGLMSGSVRTTASSMVPGPRLVTPASHYSARVTSRAPPGKVKPPPLTRTQTKTHSLRRAIAFASFALLLLARLSDIANQLYIRQRCKIPRHQSHCALKSREWGVIAKPKAIIVW